jgi:L-ascorbate metabolism protein UlaG (beta-lactamase superfamily)
MERPNLTPRGHHRGVRLQYLGTAMVVLEAGGARFVTDPALDPAGTTYDFGPWYAPRSWFASEKTYATPVDAAGLGAVDAVLLSHDQHADNFDHAGRAFAASAQVERVVTTTAGARRLARGLGLGDRVGGLAWGASTKVGPWTITATPARHGPRGTPQVEEVAGFLLEAPGEPTVWISGDTVLFPRLRELFAELRAAGKRIDVAIVHCGAVRFPKVPVLGGKLFTFDAAQAVEACRALDPGVVVPIHRDGWAHFRQPVDELRAAFATAGLADRTRLLELGEAVSL